MDTIVSVKQGRDHLNRLPPELLLQVCGFVFQDGGVSEHRRDLKNLAATCNKLLKFCRAIQWRHLRLDTTQRFQIVKLLRTLDSNPQIASNVREITLDSRETWGTFPKEDVTFLLALSKRIIGFKRENGALPNRTICSWVDASTHAIALLLGLATNTRIVNLACNMVFRDPILAQRHKNSLRRVKTRHKFPGLKTLNFNLAGKKGDLFTCSELLTAAPNLEQLILSWGLHWTFTGVTKFDASHITSLTLRDCLLSCKTLQAVAENFGKLVEFKFHQTITSYRYDLSDLQRRERMEDGWPMPSFVLGLASQSANTLKTLSIECNYWSRYQDVERTRKVRLVDPDGTDNHMISRIEFPELRSLVLGEECITSIRHEHLLKIIGGCSRLAELVITRVRPWDESFLIYHGTRMDRAMHPLKHVGYVEKPNYNRERAVESKGLLRTVAFKFSFGETNWVWKWLADHEKDMYWVERP